VFSLLKGSETSCLLVFLVKVNLIGLIYKTHTVVSQRLIMNNSVFPFTLQLTQDEGLLTGEVDRFEIIEVETAAIVEDGVTVANLVLDCIVAIGDSFIDDNVSDGLFESFVVGVNDVDPVGSDVANGDEERETDELLKDGFERKN